MPVTTLDELVAGDPPSLIKIDVEGCELLVMKGGRHVLAGSTSPVLLFEHNGYCADFGITPAEVRAFLTEAGYTMYLLDGQLTPWHSDVLLPTLNVIAARDIAAVRARIDAPGGAPAVAPVRVDVQYREHAVAAARCTDHGSASSTTTSSTTASTPGTKRRATRSSIHQPSTE